MHSPPELFHDSCRPRRNRPPPTVLATRPGSDRSGCDQLLAPLAWPPRAVLSGSVRERTPPKLDVAPSLPPWRNACTIRTRDTARDNTVSDPDKARCHSQ